MMEEEKKKRRKRRAYLDDFQEIASGEYIYRGPLYYYKEGGLSRAKALAILWGLTAVMAAAVLVGGLVPAAGMQNTVYVLLPYAGGLLSVVSVVWAMCRLTAGGDPLREYVFRATAAQFKVRSILVVLFAACTLLGSLICLLRHGAGSSPAGTAVFWAGQILLCAAALAWKSVSLSLKWEIDR